MKEGHLNADLCSTIENKYTSACICNKNSNEHTYPTHLQFETKLNLKVYTSIWRFWSEIYDMSWSKNIHHEP